MRDDLLAILVVLAARAKLGQRTDLSGIGSLQDILFKIVSSDRFVFISFSCMSFHFRIISEQILVQF